MTAQRRIVQQLLVATEFGGAAEIALRLALEARASGLAETQVWLPGAGRAAERVEAEGLPVNFFSLDRASQPGRLAPGLANATLAARLRCFGPGIAHIHSPLAYGAIRRALRLAGMLTIVHVHIEHDLAGLAWAFAVPPDVIVTCARFLEAQVRSVLPEKVRQSQTVIAVPNSIDMERFHPGSKTDAKRQLGADTNRFLLIMLANLAPHKGQETAIRAVAELRRRGIQVACRLAGVDRVEGRAYEKSLRKLVSEFALESDVHFLGFRNDTPDILQAADAMLLPSTNEGLPLAILEAQASKVPVLAAPTAGIPEVIKDGETGYLIAADDHIEYADRIERLIHDHVTHKRVAENAYIRCRSENSWETYWQRMRDIYSELLTRRDHQTLAVT